MSFKYFLFFPRKKNYIRSHPLPWLPTYIKSGFSWFSLELPKKWYFPVNFYQYRNKCSILEYKPAKRRRPFIFNNFNCNHPYADKEILSFAKEINKSSNPKFSNIVSALWGIKRNFPRYLLSGYKLVYIAGIPLPQGVKASNDSPPRCLIQIRQRGPRILRYLFQAGGVCVY